MTDSNNLTLLYENMLLEAYNEDFYRKQIARLKPQAGAYVTPEQIRAKIKRFADLKSNWRTANQIDKMVKSAIDQGRKPPQEREGAVIAPDVTLLSQEKLKELQSVDPQKVPPRLRMAYKKYTDELKRISLLERVPLELRYYNWNDLESIVDQFPDPTEKETLKKVAATGSGAKLVYDENKLKIFFGADGNECYILKKYIASERKQDPSIYRWCISADPTQSKNYHSRYRFGEYGHKTEKSSYFIYDEEKPVTDPWHFFVIHVAAEPVDARSGGKTKYMVTDSNNAGDIWMTWKEILKIQPKLKGLEDIIQFVPLSEDEKIQQVIAGDASAETFKNYSSFKVKRAYIKQSPDNKIYKKDYLKLDPVLQHLYVNMRTPVGEDAEQFDMLAKLMTMFEDSDNKTDMMDVIDKSREEMRKSIDDETNLKWLDILSSNPTIEASKEAQTVKRYKNLIKDVALGVGRAMEAQKRREVQGN